MNSFLSNVMPESHSQHSDMDGSHMSQPLLDPSLLDELDESGASGGIGVDSLSGGMGGSEKKKHICPVCLKVFVSTKGLGQHQIIHTDKKPFVCGSCGKAFRFKSNLFEHRSVHTGVHPFTCQQCGKSCRLKGNLKKHLKTHVKDGDIDEQSAAAWTANLSSPDLSEMLDVSSPGGMDKKLPGPSEPMTSPKPKRKSRPPVSRKEKIEKNVKKSPYPFEQGQQQPPTYIIVGPSNPYGLSAQDMLDPFGFAPPVNFDQQQPLIFNSGQPMMSENQMPKMKLAAGVKQELSNSASHQHRAVVQPPSLMVDESLIRISDPRQRKFLIELSQITSMPEFFQKARHIPYDPCVCHICQAEFSTRPNLQHHLDVQHKADYPHLCHVCLKVYKSAAEMEKHQEFHTRIKALIKSKSIKEIRMPKIRHHL